MKNVKMRNVTLYWFETLQSFLFCTRDQRRLLLNFIIIIFIHMSHIFPVWFERMLHYVSSFFFFIHKTLSRFCLILWVEHRFAYVYLSYIHVWDMFSIVCIQSLCRMSVSYSYICLYYTQVLHVCLIWLQIPDTGFCSTFTSLVYADVSVISGFFAFSDRVDTCCYILLSFHSLFAFSSLFAFIDRHMLCSIFSSFSWSLFRSKCAN